MDELTFQVLDKKGQDDTLTVSTDGIKIVISKIPQVRTIDLTPLSQLSDLQELRIEKTSIQEMDLTPIGKCENLEVLSLKHNKLRTIDLSPLSNCTELKSLDIRHSNLEILDITPLFLCKKLGQLKTDSALRKIAEASWKDKKDLPRLFTGMQNDRGIEWIQTRNCPLCGITLEFGYLHAQNEIRWVEQKTTWGYKGGRVLIHGPFGKVFLAGQWCKKCKLVIYDDETR